VALAPFEHDAGAHDAERATLDLVTARPLIGSLRLAIGCVCAATFACNAITGTGKYDLVDCPSGSCGGDGGGGSSGSTSGGPNGDGASSATADSGADTAAAPVITCGAGLGPVTLTVTGNAGSVSAKTGGTLSVSSGNTDTGCLGGTVEMRTSGSVADWTGPSCKDGNRGQDRCEFDVPSQGLAVTAALR
jgi:hypothetical protein